MGNVTSLNSALMSQVSGELKNIRENALTTELKTHIVDTCFAVDTNEWETGIEPKGESWVIVEQYGTDKEKAVKGHKKWVELLKKNPKTELKDVVEYGF